MGRPVKLKRTYNQGDGNEGVIRYWQVISEWHPNYGSDLSVEGMKEWGIVKNKGVKDDYGIVHKMQDMQYGA